MFAQPDDDRLDQTLAPDEAPEVLSPLAPGALVGEFVIGEKIGAGAMARVYSALHSVIDKRAAIKVMNLPLEGDNLSSARFLQEARAINRISHPNVVNVFGFGELSDGRCYLTMDLLEGQTLADRLAGGPLAVDEAIAILEQAIDGLEATHEQGIVHRDLKPENVFLVDVRGGAPLVKLFDFGIAKLIDAEPGPLRTQAGHYVGTPSYNSPEQARGEEVDPSTDVYSLGVVAFEMVTGQRPFEAASVIVVQAMHLTTPPPSARAINPALPRTLDRLLLRMLAKDAAERPGLRAVRAELAQIRSSQSLLIADQLAAERARDALPAEAKRARRAWVAAAVVSVALVAAMVASFGRGRTATAAQAAAAIGGSGRSAPGAQPAATTRPDLPAAQRAAAMVHARPMHRERARANEQRERPSKRAVVSRFADYLLDSSGRPR